MKNLIIPILLALPLTLFAQNNFDVDPDILEVVEEDGKETEKSSRPVSSSRTAITVPEGFNIYKSHWFTSLGFEALEYELPFGFTGDKDKFGPEKRKLYGGRVGVGGELYLGKGFMTSTTLEGYFLGTLFERAKNAGPELNDEPVASVKDTGQIYGLDIVQTLSYIWDFKTKNPMMDQMTYLYIEPFVELGIGRGWAFNKKDYKYDTGPSGTSCPTCTVEEYDQSFTDDLSNARLGAGVKITSTTGYFFFLKATQNRYDISKRRTKGYFYTNNGSRNYFSDADDSLDPIMVYSFGGGYRF